MSYYKYIVAIVIINSLSFNNYKLYSQEKEIIDIINRGVESNLITPELKDTIMQFLQYVQAKNQALILEKNNIKTDTIKLYPPFEYKTGTYGNDSNIRSGINTAVLFPDRLPVPERESKNKSGYFEAPKSLHQVRQRALNVDYFSKGIDGYYSKLIEMGYVGEGWIETKELRELMARIKDGLAEDVKNGGLAYNKEPEFISKMRKNKNPLMRALGGILQIMHNGSVNNYNRRPGQLQYKVQPPRN